LPYAPVGERGNHFRKLADFEPDDVVHERRERRIGFIFERDGDEPFDPGGARQPGKFQRQRTIAGNRPSDAGAVFIRDSGFRITNRRKDASLRLIIMQKFLVLLWNRMSHSIKKSKKA